MNEVPTAGGWNTPKTICFVWMTIFTSFVWAVECPPLRMRNPEGNYIVSGVRGDIVYRRIEGVDLSLDAYVQKTGTRRPAVLVVHGGGWTTGSRITYISQFLEVLTSAGYNWFAIDYRLAPRHKFPAALDDLRAALDFVRCHAREFRIDPERIALMGDNAGGHLAALLASEKPPGVRAVVTFGGILDLMSWERLQARGPESLFMSVFGSASDGAEEDRRLREASPLHHVSAGMPAFFAVHGEADREVPPEQSDRYCEAIRGTGGRCDVLKVRGAIHLPENWTPDQWGYKKEVLAWLGRQLRLDEPAHTPYGTRLKKNIPFGSYADASGNRTDLRLDAYLPEGRGPFPAVILAHGGGWEAGDKMNYLTPILEPLARAGFAWFSIDYRLTPHFRNPDQLDDLRRAIRWVRHHANEFRVDADRLAILGESASGQMVAQVAAEPCGGISGATDPVDRQPCRVRAVVSFYGVYDFPGMVTDASPRSLLVRLFGIRTLDEAGREILRRYSPLYSANRNLPPILLIHGTNERLWQHGVAMDKKLTELEVPHELYAIEGAPHGMENWEGHPEWRGYKEKLVSWLRREFR